MNTVIWVRPLSPAEIRYLHKDDIGKSTMQWGQIAIMGPEGYSTVSSCRQEVTPQWVDLGNLGIQDLSPGYPKASGGKKIQIKHFSNIIHYFLKAVSDLGIPVAEHRYAEHPVIYFQNQNSEVFIEALTYADRCAAEWEANRSLLDRWFGCNYILADSSEAISMLAGIRRILSTTSNVKR